VHAAALAAVGAHGVVLPPSAAVAGVYVATDDARGVWKAPANVSLAGVVEPVVALNEADQARLNVDPAGGRSIDVIRAFAGKGTLVWGARTLAGNDAAWRYVPVRRLCLTIGTALRRSLAWFTFEPNAAPTWTRVRGAVENYLYTTWRAGALLGATPRDAFFVRCGLGDTMTAQDVLDGRLVLEVGLACARPAEFLILRLSLRTLESS
jgi:phage tail sheath protein FI